jgi:hypothetical protein
MQGVFVPTTLLSRRQPRSTAGIRIKSGCNRGYGSPIGRSCLTACKARRLVKMCPSGQHERPCLHGRQEPEHVQKLQVSGGGVSVPLFPHRPILVAATKGSGGSQPAAAKRGGGDGLPSGSRRVPRRARHQMRGGHSVWRRGWMDGWMNGGKETWGRSN